MTTPAAHRASNRFGLRFARTGPRSEDAQPNESVNKRQRQPPTVNSAAHSRRPWWVGRGQNRPPATHPSIQSVARERSGSTRRVPTSTSVKHAVPYARPHTPLATTGGTGYPNTTQTPMDTGPRQPRQGYCASTLEIPVSVSPASNCHRLLDYPSVGIKHEIPTQTMASRFTPSVSPVSSETLVSDNKVKVERSVSPELYAQPQLNTSGSKRYAPLPLECRRSHPNHAAARSAWARKEQEALRRLGLRVVRTFIREDGMVIDWPSTASLQT
ncbi:hypothetical protein EI94DRAFT_924285 [Lactarius quietus]|nr:hypothetical protein EI94DRAFT_924285 [Lactarius quietus]